MRFLDVGAGVVIAITVGCAESRDETTDTFGGIDSGGDGVETLDGDGGGDGVLDIGGGGGDGADGGDDSACPCGQNADLIYLLSDSAELWTYNPPLDQFARLGTFSCPAPALDTTFSMGVARSGTAWVMYTPSGEIFHVDVNAANQCSDPGYTPGQNGFTLFGMAFASQSAANPCDTLYAHSWSGGLGGFGEGPGSGQLGRVDNLVPSALSTIDFDGGELTGTGDGRLFAFAGVGPAKLVEYDKSDGSVVEITPLPGLELTQAFAFAFWGGDFYFFTEGGGFPTITSKVTRLDHDGDGSLVEVNPTAPMRVVGAGVSTCAPFVPPG